MLVLACVSRSARRRAAHPRREETPVNPSFRRGKLNPSNPLKQISPNLEHSSLPKSGASAPRRDPVRLQKDQINNKHIE